MWGLDLEDREVEGKGSGGEGFSTSEREETQEGL